MRWLDLAVVCLFLTPFVLILSWPITGSAFGLGLVIVVGLALFSYIILPLSTAFDPHGTGQGIVILFTLFLIVIPVGIGLAISELGRHRP